MEGYVCGGGGRAFSWTRSWISFGDHTSFFLMADGTDADVAARAESLKETGVRLWRGGSVVDAAAAVAAFHAAAALGHAGAMRNLGVCYRQGRGDAVPQNVDEAARWTRRAAEAGHAGAMDAVGKAYATGAASLQLLRLQGAGGFSDAERASTSSTTATRTPPNAGPALGTPAGQPGTRTVSREDLEEAVRWYRRAAEAGDAGGCLHLAECLRDGVGVPERDGLEARRWMRRAAELGNVDAMVQLAELMLHRSTDTALPAECTPADETGGPTAWLAKAAERGHVRAAARLAECYRDGTGGVGVDHARAVALFTTAATQGDATAQAALGRMFLVSRSNLVPAKDAVAWLRKAADAGVVEATYDLGRCAETGTGMPRDLAQAAACYRAAADRGFTDAIYAMGSACLWGEPGFDQYRNAASWFRLGARKGNIFCMLSLSAIYRTGRGLPRADQSKSVHWLAVAAEAGSERAMVDLGVACVRGRGRAQDTLAAAAWFRRAVSSTRDHIPEARTQLWRLLQEHAWVGAPSATTTDAADAAALEVELPVELWEKVACALMQQAIQGPGDANADDAARALWRLAAASRVLHQLVMVVWQRALQRHREHRMLPAEADWQWAVCERDRARALQHMRVCLVCPRRPVVCASCVGLVRAPQPCVNFYDASQIYEGHRWLGCGSFLCGDCVAHTASATDGMCPRCRDEYTHMADLASLAGQLPVIDDDDNNDPMARMFAEEAQTRLRAQERWPGWFGVRPYSEV